MTRRLSLRLTAILTTHKHHDHAGGNLELQKACGGSLRVYGHAKDTIPGVTRVVEPGDRIMIGETEIGVVHVPCHTTGHVVYVVLRREDGAGGDVELGGGANRITGDDLGSGANAISPHRAEAVFTGDAIINGGVGAFFHGGPRDCYDNLHRRLADVPDDALIFSGHEYMLMNLRFAKWLDEDDETTAVALREVIVRRHQGLSTMPSSFGVERRVNPYFRVADAAFLRKVHALAAAIEAGKTKRWYRRYLPSAFEKSAKRADAAANEPGSERDGARLAARKKGGDGTRSTARNRRATRTRGLRAWQSACAGSRWCRNWCSIAISWRRAAPAGGRTLEAAGRIPGGVDRRTRRAGRGSNRPTRGARSRRRRDARAREGNRGGEPEVRARVRAFEWDRRRDASGGRRDASDVV